MLRRPLCALVAVASALALSSAPALASGGHLDDHPSEPRFKDGGLTLIARGELSDLHHGDVRVILRARAIARVTCTNRGGHTARDPEWTQMSVSGSEVIPHHDISTHGDVSFVVKAGVHSSVVAGAPDCPSHKWTERIKDLAFTSAVITVKQKGEVVQTLRCRFASPTKDGPVPGWKVSCRQR